MRFLQPYPTNIPGTWPDAVRPDRSGVRQDKEDPACRVVVGEEAHDGEPVPITIPVIARLERVGHSDRLRIGAP